MEHRQFESMLAVARARLARHAPEELAQRAGVEYADGAFIVSTLGKTVRGCLPECVVTPPLPNWHTLTLLHYLDLADGTPPSGELMSFGQYPDGMVRGGGFDRDAEQAIRTLGVLPPEELERRCEALGANFETSNADLCARFDFAPRYPVWLKVWFGDEEFPASGHLFVGASAPRYLTIEDAVTVGALILDGLTGAGHWTE